jgi:hypothetical protein
MLLRRLYEKNKSVLIQHDLVRMRKFENVEDVQWGGGRLRLMLQCIYTIAFLCLLRFDEVLRIQLKDIEVIDKEKGHIKLTLPFRKTHQYGGMSPFRYLRVQKSSLSISIIIAKNYIWTLSIIS